MDLILKQQTALKTVQICQHIYSSVRGINIQCGYYTCPVHKNLVNLVKREITQEGIFH
jgi:hypothetical protein